MDDGRLPPLDHTYTLEARYAGQGIPFPSTKCFSKSGLPGYSAIL